MSTTCTEWTGEDLRIVVTGRFDYHLHRSFKQSYEQHGKKPKTYSVDLGGVDYIDSSALGMLLILREYAGGKMNSVVLCNCSPEVRQLLQVANFERLFSIC